ncbi:MAG: diguanylate cyclase [Desulfosporosinus sp.]
MKLAEILNIPKLKELMERLYSASSIPSAIIEINGKIIVEAGWLNIGTMSQKVNIESELLCKQNIQYLKKHLGERGSIEPYFCYTSPNGMIEAAAPIIIDGKHVATIFIGQMHYFLQFAEMLGKMGIDHFESQKEALEVTRQLQADNERLQNLSRLDGLTGIANRRYFDQKLLQEIKRANRDKTQLSLIMLDIDYFKAFNDTYGHLKGDECLKMVASTLKMNLKRPGDFLARYGGEEFTVILPNTDDIGAAIIAEKLRASIESAGIVHINSLSANYVTVSLGVVTRFSEQTQTPDDMISAADRALFRSKHEGRNRVSV